MMQAIKKNKPELEKHKNYVIELRKELAVKEKKCFKNPDEIRRHAI